MWMEISAELKLVPAAVWLNFDTSASFHGQKFGSTFNYRGRTRLLKLAPTLISYNRAFRLRSLVTARFDFESSSSSVHRVDIYSPKLPHPLSILICKLQNLRESSYWHRKRSVSNLCFALFDRIKHQYRILDSNDGSRFILYDVRISFCQYILISVDIQSWQYVESQLKFLLKQKRILFYAWC